MGFFRTLIAPVPCLKCSTVRLLPIQFDAGGDQAMPSYELGDIAVDLVPNTHFEGSARSFCPACELDFERHECIAMHESLADEIDAGRVRIISKVTFEIISPRFVRQFGCELASQMEGRTMHQKRLLQKWFVRDYDLFWRGRQVQDCPLESAHSTGYFAFASTLMVMAEITMERAGWPQMSGIFRADIVVATDNASRLEIIYPPCATLADAKSIRE